MRSWFKIATIAAGLVLFGSQSAVASDTVGWKTVSSSTWACGDWVAHGQTFQPGLSPLNFKACAVTNASGGAQAVLVVQNANELHGWDLEKGRVVFESQLGGDVWCAPSLLNSGFTRGCYAPTVQVGKCQYIDIPRVELTINGHTGVAYGRNYIKTPC
ncbi:hypothetical protein AB0937_29005 [Streptomyces sp. NPDC047880]|uniref:hypothetical protein n=1 Tax=Streptomyces sp. NPDC047880 TaxID=3155626 RepID=UPI003451E750